MSDSESVWNLPKSPRNTSSPPTEATADVCVVGCGIAGLTAAYRLLTAGRSVLLLDAGLPGGGETGHTTAHLSWVPERRFDRLASIRGDEVARLAAESHRQAIRDIEQIAAAESIACEFSRVEGYLVAGSRGRKTIDAEHAAVERLGIDHTAVDPVPMMDAPGLRFPDQARFHPTKYIEGLAATVVRRGGKIHTGTRVVRIDGGEPCMVETEVGTKIAAGAVVIATNAPFDAGLSLQFRVAAYSTYAVAMPVPAGTVADALVWDTDDPYHYVRLLPKSDDRAEELLIVGGEDHKTGQAADQAERWAKLADWAKARFPDLGDPVYHWSGEVFETADGLGLNGRATWEKTSTSSPATPAWG